MVQPKAALGVIECWIIISGFPFRHENTDTIHSYVVQHEMGRKMSNYLAETVSQFISRVLPEKGSF